MSCMPGRDASRPLPANMEQLPPGMMRTVTLDFAAAMEHIRVATGVAHDEFPYFLRERCRDICKYELLQNFGTHTSLAWLHLYLLNTFWDAFCTSHPITLQVECGSKRSTEWTRTGAVNEAGRGSPSPWAQPAKTMRWDTKNGPNDELIDSQWLLETGRRYAQDEELLQFLAVGTRPSPPSTSISLYVGPHLKTRKRFPLPRVTRADDENGRRPASPSPESRSLADAKAPPAAPDRETGWKRWPPSRLDMRYALPPPVFKLPELTQTKKRKVRISGPWAGTPVRMGSGEVTDRIHRQPLLSTKTLPLLKSQPKNPPRCLGIGRGLDGLGQSESIITILRLRPWPGRPHNRHQLRRDPE